jgi:hypothetical protein
MKLFRRARRFGSVEKKIRYLTLLPVELWTIVLTEAVRPLWSLDTYCFSSNMEEYYHTIAKDVFRSVNERDQPIKARRSLRLVCRRFNDIIKTIPKAPERDWILEQDNEPRSYRAPPVPQWSASGHWERIDVRLEFEDPSTVIASYTPVTIFRLSIRRTSLPRDPLRYDPLYQLALVRHATHVISHPNKLKVLHLQLEHCCCIQPSEFNQCMETISHLRTLSLCLGTSNIRDMIYEPLSLPSLRVLFLKFPVYGTTETTLRTWTFVSLNILSLDLRIARFGVEPVPLMPTCVSSFIERHGGHLYGLRLQPGPWAAPRQDRYLLPMELEAEQKLWRQLPELKVLSTDFTYFSMVSATAQKHEDSPFRNIVTLNQIGKLISSNLLARLIYAIDLSPALQALHLSSPAGRWGRGAFISQYEPHFLTLRDLCTRRGVSLYY